MATTTISHFDRSTVAARASRLGLRGSPEHGQIHRNASTAHCGESARYVCRRCQIPSLLRQSTLCVQGRSKMPLSSCNRQAGKDLAGGTGDLR